VNTEQILPPQSIEAERAVLGSMLLDKDALLDGVDMLFRDAFYREAHALLFDAISDMAAARVEVDLVTLNEELTKRKLLETIGGTSYLTGLVNSVPTAANLKYYAEIVTEKYRLRQLGTVCADVARDAAGEKKGSIDLLMDLQARADAIHLFKQGRDPAELLDVSRSAMDVIEDQSKNQRRFTGLRTGLPDVDAVTGGLQRGNLIILAGRPSMGKSALLQRLVQGVAECQPGAGAVLWSSLEMSREQIGQRWLCSLGKVDSNDIRIGRVSGEDVDRAHNALQRLMRLQNAVYIDDSPGQTVMEIRSKARRIKNRHGKMALIAVDYLQLMGGDKAAERRDLEIGAISRGLKGMAIEFDCPVLALSQLNRAVEGRQDKRPTLADLRESGSLEQDADVVAFVYREEYYFPEKRPGEADLIIAKQRDGPCDTVALSFAKKYAAFESLEWKQPMGVSA
jgi:replicative DNA helicase